MDRSALKPHPILCSLIALVAALFGLQRVAFADFDDAPPAPASDATRSPVSSPAPTPAVTPTASSSEAVPPSSTPRAGSATGSSKSGPAGKPAGKSSTTAPTQAGKSADSGIDHNSGAPVAYSSQSLEGSLSQGRILLKGDVEIEQGDAIMKSDVAEIFSPKGSTSPNRALAKGRVSLFKSASAQSAELRAVASELEYFMSSRKVILRGKPKIWRGRELLQGEVIEVFLDTNEIKVRGARGVMDPSSGASPVGNQSGSGVQTAPTKKSSGQNRR